MNREECLKCMKAPADKRHPAFHSIIQIVVTSCCDRSCSNCTYMVKQRRPEHISIENFRAACESLVGYPGVVGLIGGNPCIHPRFPELCEIMTEVIPDKRKRGLWTNRLFNHGPLCRKTFGFFNLNVHGDKISAKIMKRELPDERIFGEEKNSIHGAVMVSMVDMGINEETRWQKISECDINQNWSAAVVQIDGELGGYFCEIASSFAALEGRHTNAAEVVPGWWGRAMTSRTFSSQVDYFCHDCGVPLRLRGHVDTHDMHDVSEKYERYMARSPKRQYMVHRTLGADETITFELTDYQRLRTET